MCKLDDQCKSAVTTPILVIFAIIAIGFFVISELIPTFAIANGSTPIYLTVGPNGTINGTFFANATRYPLLNKIFMSLNETKNTTFLTVMSFKTLGFIFECDQVAVYLGDLSGSLYDTAVECYTINSNWDCDPPTGITYSESASYACSSIIASVYMFQVSFFLSLLMTLLVIITCFIKMFSCGQCGFSVSLVNAFIAWSAALLQIAVVIMIASNLSGMDKFYEQRGWLVNPMLPTGGLFVILGPTWWTTLFGFVSVVVVAIFLSWDATGSVLGVNCHCGKVEDSYHAA